LELSLRHLNEQPKFQFTPKIKFVIQAKKIGFSDH
jgi:hypothetical protein